MIEISTTKIIVLNLTNSDILSCIINMKISEKKSFHFYYITVIQEVPSLNTMDNLRLQCNEYSDFR